MSFNEKPKPNDLCKNHAARGDKEFYRICPSKLNKRELEDLYYTLLDKNLELKREINDKNEKIRTLSTKVQRLTESNKPHTGKSCCVKAKALISEQKETIDDLKVANDTMTERVKRLNAKLYTAKQFLKQGSPLNNKGLKSNTGPSNSSRNLSNVLVTKEDGTDNMRSTAAPAGYLVTEPPETKPVETNTGGVEEEIKFENGPPETKTVETNIEEIMPEKQEKENESSKMLSSSAEEEFKNKISDLKQELSKTHAEYASRMNHLERKVIQLQTARSQDAYVRRLRGKGAEHEDLATQVVAEKNKVAELEMRLKSAAMSQEVANTIAEHLNNANQLEEKRASQIEKLRNGSTVNGDNQGGLSTIHPRLLSTVEERYASQIEKQRGSTVNGDNQGGVSTPHPLSLSPVPLPAPRKSDELTVPDDQLYKSDDSGYAETRRDSDQEGNADKNNQDLVKKIAYLQAQLDDIKNSTNDNLQPTRKPEVKSAKQDSYDVIVNVLDVPVIKNVKDYNCFIVDPGEKMIIEIEHVNKDATESDPDLTKNAEETKGIGVPESQKREPKGIVVPESRKRVPQYIGVPESQTREPIDIGVPESQKREPNIQCSGEHSGECSRKLPEMNFQQSDTTNKQKHSKDLYMTRKSNTSKELQTIQERISDHMSKPLYEVTKPVEEANKQQPNYPPLVQTRNFEKPNSVFPETQKGKQKKCNKVICECPKEKVPLQVLKQEGSNEVYKILPYNSIEEFRAYKTMQNASTPKSDRHNSMQIPGPLLVTTSRGDSNASKTSNSSLKLKLQPFQGRKASTGIKERSGTSGGIDSKEPCLIKKEFSSTRTNKGDVNAADTKPVNSSSTHVAFENNYEAPNESFHRKKFSFNNGPVNDVQNNDELSDITANGEDANQQCDVSNEKATDTKSGIVQCSNQNCNSHRVSDKIQPRLVGSRRPPICLCAETLQSIPVCGGNPRSHKPDSDAMRCLCAYKPGSLGGGGAQELLRRPSMRSREHLLTLAPNSGTFTVLSPEEKHSRATSPANTDYEISHMSDLPTEKDGTTTCAHATTTTDSSTPCNDMSLSEGEVPNKYAKRAISVSVGEYTGGKSAGNADHQSSTEKMEAALEAISQELSRCRALLEIERSREVTYGHS